jgi:response regulator RpfG family c-di-GMP phosphodiesterase
VIKSKILFVDDDVNILAAFERHLHRKYDLVTSDSAAKALEILQTQGPFAAVISDYRMPDMNGIQFLSQVHRSAPNTVRIMLTGQADMQAAIDGINEGHLFRFLVKPCLTETIIQTVNDAVRQYLLLTAERELLEKTLSGSIKILTEVLSVVRPNAFSRSLRIATFGRRIAEAMKLPDVWEVEVAARISHAGFVTIPQDTIDKYWAGQKLNAEEQKMIDEYPAQGQKLIGHIPRMEKIADGIAYQCKNFDGSGLPENSIKGEEIPILGRILKVALAFDQEINSGLSEAEAIENLLKKQSWFDPDILAALHVTLEVSDRGPIEKVISVKDLKPGAVLADDIKTTSGQLLVIKGSELCEVNISLLHNIELRGNLAKPLRIFRSQEG